MRNRSKLLRERPPVRIHGSSAPTIASAAPTAIDDDRDRPSADRGAQRHGPEDGSDPDRVAADELAGARRPVRALRAVAATADQAATQAAMEVFTRGGNAVDAAIGANAAIAVTAPHLCGLGGDLFALVRTPDGAVHGLNAVWPRRVRAPMPRRCAPTAIAIMPMRHDIRTATVPGCVDGWAALHERFGSPRPGHACWPRPCGSPPPGSRPARCSCARSAMLDDAAAERFGELVEQATGPGARVRRPGVALTLRAIGAGGREAFYGGAFGEGLLALGDGWFTEADLVAHHADWVDAAAGPRVRRRLCTRSAPTRRATCSSAPPASPTPSGCPPTPTTRRGPTSSSRRRRRPASTGPTSSTTRPTAPRCSTRSTAASTCSTSSGPGVGRWRRTPATRRTCAPPTPPGSPSA